MVFINKTIFFFVFIVICILSILKCYSQIINTFAGIGTAGCSSNVVPAISTPLKYPARFAIDKFGNFYIVERLCHKIAKINQSGTISDFAGNGTATYSGDSGVAILAGINDPCGITIDSLGNIYIADNADNRIRKIDAISNIITTYAGNGIPGHSGDSTLAINAEIENPSDVCIDAVGNLYIAAGDGRIRKVNSSGIITTVVGNGAVGYSGEGGLATAATISGADGMCVDAINNLYFADAIDDRVLKINVISGTISTVAGNGGYIYNGDGIPATSAALIPLGVTFDALGNLFISDKNQRIRKIDPNGIIHTIAGNGITGFSGDNNIADSAEFYWPYGIKFDSCGNLYIADEQNNRIRKVTFDTSCGHSTFVSNVTVNLGISIYPNPSNAILHIDNVNEVSSYILLNMIGAAMQTGILKQGNNNINIASLAPGLYLLQLQNESMSRVEKIIKE